VADDEDDYDGEEHHGDLVVSALVGRDGVVQPRRSVDGSVDARVKEEERGERDHDERDRVGD
jgi:hypothetical protein